MTIIIYECEGIVQKFEDLEYHMDHIRKSGEFISEREKVMMRRCGIKKIFLKFFQYPISAVSKGHIRLYTRYITAFDTSLTEEPLCLAVW